MDVYTIYIIYNAAQQYKYIYNSVPFIFVFVSLLASLFSLFFSSRFFVSPETCVFVFWYVRLS